jgi:hypothetical protein
MMRMSVIIVAVIIIIVVLMVKSMAMVAVIMIVSYIIYHLFSFSGSLTGLQNPYGYGNSHIFLSSQEVKSIYKCATILVARPSAIFGDLA